MSLGNKSLSKKDGKKIVSSEEVMELDGLQRKTSFKRKHVIEDRAMSPQALVFDDQETSARVADQNSSSDDFDNPVSRKGSDRMCRAKGRHCKTRKGGDQTPSKVHVGCLCF